MSGPMGIGPRAQLNASFQTHLEEIEVAARWSEFSKEMSIDFNCHIMFRSSLRQLDQEAVVNLFY